MTDVAIDERRLIRASAGTGKTYQLTNRYISRLLNGIAPDEILAVTFTRNAAAEILDRVLVRLAAAADSDTEAERLAEAIAEPGLTCDRCRETLAGVVDTLQQLRISTLDSYFSQVATSFSLELGLPTPWQILDDLEARQLKREAVRRLVRSGSNTTLQRLVNLMTGSDTTRSIEDSLVQIVSKLHTVYLETAPDAWRWLTPPPRSSDANIEAATAKLTEASWPEGKRWDSAREQAIDIVANRNWQRLVGVGLGKKIVEDDLTFYGKEIPLEVVDAFGPALSLLQADTANDLAEQTAATFDILEMFDNQYAELKRQQRCVEFDDITRVLADATLGTNAARLAHRLNATVDHLLLDEFQDTSSQQWQVLEPLARDITENSQQRSFFCVGDEKQAIYGWRGGVAGIFGTLEKRLDGLAHQDLKVSYRSSKAVIETINDVFSGASRHADLQDLDGAVADWTGRYVEHEAHHDDRSGYTCLRTHPGDPGRVDKDLFNDLLAEIIGDSGGHSVGILVRQNKTVGELVTQLRLRGVAASQEGGFPLTDSAPVLVLLSLVRLADHPADSLAAFHVANSPLGSLLELDHDSTPGDFARVSRSLREQLANRGYGTVLGHYARQLATSTDLDERFRLAQFVRLATRYDHQATLRPAAFDRFVQNERFNDPSTDRVRVMTIHQAKGLEFDVVILPELDARLAGRSDLLAAQRPDPTAPPDRVLRTRSQDIRPALDDDIKAVYQADRNRDATEALCVMYVAMTRARYALHMLIPPSGKTEKTLPPSAAGLLRAALCGNDTVAPGQVLAERGDPDWHREVELAPPPPPDDTPLDLQLTPITGSRRRGRGRRAPSGLEGSSMTDVAAVFEIGSTANREHGTLIHAWLEAIEWADEIPDNDRLELIARRQQIHVDDLADRADRFRDQLQQPELAQLLTRESYSDASFLPLDKDITTTLAAGELEVEVHCEYPFAINRDGEILNGTIDRLVLLYSGKEIVAADTIDFKTDHVDGEAQIDAKVEFYRGQLEAYRDAVGEIFQLDQSRIATRLAFLGAGRIASVSEHR
ncbi:MAG: UvrD-helicase domain-containing protein [Planctomycetota bacterium]|nr:UvrD-helicase domain-containing protein [Planctomycetota bacterium]